MNQWMKAVAMASGACLMTWAGIAVAAESGETNRNRDFQFKLRLRAEYDDNIYERKSGTTDSFKFIVEPEAIYNAYFTRSTVALRYRPSYTYWSDRDGNDNDLHHEVAVDVAYEATPRLSLGVKESFIYAEQPELMDRGVVITEQDSYIYNRLNGDATYRLSAASRVDVGARHTLLRYEQSDVANLEDYDIFALGATYRRATSADTTWLGEGRYETISYDGPDRGSDSLYGGLGLEKSLSKDMITSLRGGVQGKTFSADGIDDEVSPYVDGSFTYLPSPKTRLTAGGGYSMFEADVFPYANQDRLLAYLSASHDLTARISLFLSGSYQISDYSADQSIDQTTQSGDGTENIVQVSARASYKLNRSNWLEANYQYMNLDSDLREDFDRNRVSLGWRTTL